MGMTIEFRTKVNVSDRDISDILCTALYDSIDYWCAKLEIEGVEKTDVEDVESKEDVCAEHLVNGGALIFYEDEDETGENLIPHRVKLEDFLRGLVQWLEEYAMTAPPLEDMNGGLYLDTGMIDSNDADSIVQLAVFGKLVYG